jgi:hypothetical protein
MLRQDEGLRPESGDLPGQDGIPLVLMECTGLGRMRSPE